MPLLCCCIALSVSSVSLPCPYMYLACPTEPCLTCIAFVELTSIYPYRPLHLTFTCLCRACDVLALYFALSIGLPLNWHSLLLSITLPLTCPRHAYAILLPLARPWHAHLQLLPCLYLFLPLTLPWTFLTVSLNWLHWQQYGSKSMYNYYIWVSRLDSFHT
jgi:hypothetical protein